MTLQGSIFLPASRAPDLRQILVELLAARAEPEKLVDYFHEDARVRVIGHRRDYRFAGDYCGKAQILDLCRRIDAEITMTDHRILSLVVEGDNVAMRRSVLARHHAGGGERRLIMANWLKFRDLRIAEGFQFADTNWLKRMLGDD